MLFFLPAEIISNPMRIARPPCTAGDFYPEKQKCPPCRDLRLTGRQENYTRYG